MCIVSAAVAAGALGAGATAGTASAGLLTGVSAFSAMAMVASILGLGMSAAGQMQQQGAANAQAKYQGQVAANNAATAENEAHYAEVTAQRNADSKKREMNTLIGAQRAAEGSSGAVVDSGSFMDVRLDTAERGTMDAMALLQEGDLAAWRARSQAANFTAQSGLYDSASKTSALMPVAGGLLTGAGNIGANWYKMTNSKT